MNFSKYALAVVKPDAFRDGVSDAILGELEDSDLEILLHCRREIAHGQAVKLYEDTRESAWYEPGIDSLRGDSEIVLLKAEDRAIEVAVRVRGRSTESGIRLKFPKPIIQEMLDDGIGESEALAEAARNRIHVPDNKEKTIEAMLVLFEPQDWEMLRVVEPELEVAVRSELLGPSRTGEAPSQL